MYPVVDEGAYFKIFPVAQYPLVIGQHHSRDKVCQDNSAGFCLAEGVIIALLMQVLYGSGPFFSLVFTRMLPEAVYTGIVGTFMLRFISRRNVLQALMRRSFLKE